MRHILEHNYEWARILDNALASFTQRMAPILFTQSGNQPRKSPFSPTFVSRALGSASRHHGPPNVTYIVQRI